MREFVNALSKFEGLGVDFISYNEGTDTTTPQGKLDLPPESGGLGSERHAAARMVIPSISARASAGVRWPSAECRRRRL